MTKILLVDDEATLLETLTYNLKREGYEVVTAMDGREALEAARREHPDLIVLDLMLPRMDGLTVTRILRKEEMNVPILMLTAKADEVDKVVGLEVGADDYITKPFGLREVMARIRAALRRTQRLTPEAEAEPATAPSHERLPTVAPLVLAGGDLIIDTARREVRVRGESVALKPKEFDLLAFLATNHGVVLSRETLLEHVWGYDFAGDSRTVDVHIRWLREKLETDPARPQFIETVRGSGYRLRDASNT